MTRPRPYLVFGLPMILLLIVAACGGASEADRQTIFGNEARGEDEALELDLYQGQRSVAAALPTPAPGTAVADSFRPAQEKDGMMELETSPGIAGLS